MTKEQKVQLKKLITDLETLAYERGRITAVNKAISDVSGLLAGLPLEHDFSKLKLLQEECVDNYMGIIRKFIDNVE